MRLSSLVLFLFFLFVPAWAADPQAKQAPDGPHDFSQIRARRGSSESAGKAGLTYSFRLSGVEANGVLVVSNSSGAAGFVRVLPSRPGAAATSVKILVGETVTLSADEIGWASSAGARVKMSAGLQAALRLPTGLTRLPAVNGVGSYEVFSEDRRSELGMRGTDTAVVALSPGSISAAYGAAPLLKAGEGPAFIAGDGANPEQQIVDITVGQTVNGALQTTDARTRFGDGSFADSYRLTVSSAQTFRIEMRSTSVDAFLGLFDSDDSFLAFNDDDAGGLLGTDARIEYTLFPGTYIIEASSFEPGETGPYTLTVTSLGPAKSPALLTVGQTVNGVLEATDNRTILGDGSLADYFDLNVPSAQTLTITLRSTAFDAYLVVVDVESGQITQDDDSGGGTDALLELPFQPGRYFVEATTLTPGQQGPYTLSVSGTPPAPPAITTEGVVSSAGFVGGSVVPGEILSFFGTNVGPSALVEYEFGANGRFVTRIGGTRILFDGQPAPMVFALTSQSSAVAPFSLAGRSSTTIQIEKDGVLSNAVTIPVSVAKPTIFSINQTGRGPGAVLNQDFSLNSAANPAARGSAVQIFMTGGGATNPPSVDGALAPSTAQLAELVAPVSVTIGGRTADVVYKGGAPGLINGLVQVNVLVAEDTPVGGAVELLVTVGGVRSQAGITIAVN